MLFSLRKSMPISSLKTLLEPWICLDLLYDRRISGLSTDTRTLKKGEVFIALKGYEQDGRDFIESAIAKGAVAVLLDGEETGDEAGRSFVARCAPLDDSQKEIPLIPIAHLTSLVGAIAARFYQYPTRQLNIIGVTGTNGKTSCTQWIAQAFNGLGHRCGVIGTLGYGFSQDLISSERTTPFPLEMQKILAEFVEKKAETVVMEVSSHALSQHRVVGVDFDLAVFTNLSHDHLDYHGNVAEYAKAKKRLFDWPGLKKRVLNVDDPYGWQWFWEYKSDHEAALIGYSLQADMPQKIPQQQLVYATDVIFSENGIAATIHSPWGVGRLKTGLIGRFNLSNLLAVLASLCLQGVALDEVLKVLSCLKSPPGRMEVLGGGEGGRAGGEQPTVVIDYSHTPDALEQALKSLGEHAHGKVWCVFGCGGDRDKTKRPLMAQIAQKYADYVIVTDDNPRHETPSAIVCDILMGLTADSTAVVEHDRRQAIQHAINCAQVGDMVLIAGKGHETYQQIGDEKFPFNDKVEALLALDARKK
jgi:UDP-N-acetylmuramoyl-L-alanyl-D-glutamate--2,6-diaminopimelate ligase